MNETERLLQAYQEEMNRLVLLYTKKDYSEKGNRDFHQQSERVYWAKNALVMAESKRELVRS